MSASIGISGETAPASGTLRPVPLAPGTVPPVAAQGKGRPGGSSVPSTVFARQLGRADAAAAGDGAAPRSGAAEPDPASGLPPTPVTGADARVAERLAEAAIGLPEGVVPATPRPAVLPTAARGAGNPDAARAEATEPSVAGSPDGGDPAALSAVDEARRWRIDPLGSASAPRAVEPRPGAAQASGLPASGLPVDSPRTGAAATAQAAVRSGAAGEAHATSIAAPRGPLVSGAPTSPVAGPRPGAELATDSAVSPPAAPSPSSSGVLAGAPPAAGPGLGAMASRSSVAAAPSAGSRTVEVSAQALARSARPTHDAPASLTSITAASALATLENEPTGVSPHPSRTAPSPVHRVAAGESVTIAGVSSSTRPSPVTAPVTDAGGVEPDMAPSPPLPIETEDILPRTLVSRRAAAAGAVRPAEAEPDPRVIAPDAMPVSRVEREARGSVPVEWRANVSPTAADTAAASPPTTLAAASSPGLGIGSGPLAARADEPFGSLPVAPHSVPLNGRGDGAEALAAGVRWSAASGGGRALVNVSPEGLGPLSIRVDLEGDRVSVSIVAAQPLAREALEALVPRLREQLAADGQPGTRVEVEISGGRGHGGAPADTGQSADPHRSGTGRAETTIEDDPVAAHDPQGSDALSRLASRSIIDAWA